MSKYVLVYQGGGGALTPAQVEKSIAEWTAWFGTIGADLVDLGNPFGAGTSIGSDGSVSEAAAGLSGYSVISAADLDAAAAVAKSCPVLAEGGSVNVHEALDM